MENMIDTEKFNLIQSIRITFADIRQAYLSSNVTNTIDDSFIKETHIIQQKQESWVNQWYDRNSK
jgi:hypothetical protein